MGAVAVLKSATEYAVGPWAGLSDCMEIQVCLSTVVLPRAAVVPPGSGLGFRV